MRYQRQHLDRERERRRLVLWLGDHAAAQLDDLVGAGLRGVALSLPSAARNRAALKAATDTHGLRAALDPEPWRNQLAPGHSRRAGAFSKFPYALEHGLVWDPERPLAPSERDDLPRAWLDAQVASGGTDLIVSGHVYDEPRGAARANDLALAASGLEYAEAQLLRAGAPQGPPRQVIVQLSVRPRDLTASDIDWLVDAYGELAADAYWINVINFTGSARQFERIRHLARALEERAQTGVTVCGLGRLWPAALIEDFDSVCFGYQRSLFTFPPPDLAEEIDDDTGLGVHVYHRAVLGAVRLGDSGEWVLRVLFRRFPCECGHHPAGEPPEGKIARVAHNAWCAAQELDWVSTVPNATAIEGRVSRAASLRRSLSMTKLATAWSAIASDDGLRRTG